MDYTNIQVFNSASEAQRQKSKPLQYMHWWMEEDDEIRSKACYAQASAIFSNNVERRQANLRHTRLYENVEIDGLTGSDFAQSLVRQALLGTNFISFNVISACVDTLAAKITKNKPRPNFITSGASWAQQRKARRLDKFMQGLFHETRVYEKAKQVFVDAATTGTGILHVYQNDDGRLECERVLPDELNVDDFDAMYGKPRTMYRRKTIQREVLLSLFPEKAEDIIGLGTSAPRATRQGVIEMVDVWEAWHLPTKKGTKDGKHCIVIDGLELLSEPWELSEFPFVVLRYKPRTLGFWGKGVSEHLIGIQLELNRLIRSISEQLRRKGKNRLYVQMGSKVNPGHLTNGIGDIVYYTGAVPVPDNQNAVSAEDYAQVDRLYQRAFQEVGVSELSAAARKPSGLDAAVALREYNDIESERFALVHQAWETFFLDYGALCLDLIANHYGAKGYKIRTPSRRCTIEVDWRDIDLDRDSYVMQCWPVSSLPQTPAARLQRVNELIQAGFIDEAVGKRLLDFPDIEAETNLVNSVIDDVDATISKILDEEEPVLMPLEHYQNYDMILKRGTSAYLFARHFPDIEEERLDLLRALIDDAAARKADLMEAMQPPTPPQAAPQPQAMTPEAQ